MYQFINTWNPNDPCVDWSLGLRLEDSTPKNKGQFQVPGMYKSTGKVQATAATLMFKGPFRY